MCCWTLLFKLYLHSTKRFLILDFGQKMLHCMLMVDKHAVMIFRTPYLHRHRLLHKAERQFFFVGAVVLLCHRTDTGNAPCRGAKGPGDICPITHHICSLIFFPLSSTVLILKSTPAEGEIRHTHIWTHIAFPVLFDNPQCK